MRDTASVRKNNIRAVRRILWNGETWTKLRIAKTTGLSVATCNTILNAMEANGEVLGEKTRVLEVGRSTTAYRYNESFGHVLCLEYALILGRRHIACTVLSMTGVVVRQERKELPVIDGPVIARTVKALVAAFPRIAVISVGTPSIARHGIVRHCDLPELEDTHLAADLEREFGVPVVMENDMHLKAYGYYKKHCVTDDIVTLANFPANVLPGTSTIVSGTILKGANHFAGMVGFLQHGVDREQVAANLTPKKYFPYAVRSITAIIAIVNPSVILFSGDLLDGNEVEKIRLACLKSIPAEYVPPFRFVAGMDEFFVEGMFQRALDRKEEL